MRDELLAEYERELSYLRRSGAEFARKYPKIASRLLLEPSKCDDPHVERLLEGFAFLAARIQLRIADDFPELSEALLGVVYPHYVRPLPSMSLVQLRLDPEQGKVAAGYRVPRGTLLYSKPVGGTPCKFQTCYDTTLWPVTVASAKWVSPQSIKPALAGVEAVGLLRLELQCPPSLGFDKLDLQTLRLHLSAEPTLASTLYELLCNNCPQVVIRDATPGSRAKEQVVLPRSAISPVGFAEREGMLPPPRRAFLGYQLLQEYFTFPDKFMFLDVTGFERARGAGFGEKIEVLFPIGPFQRPERRQMLETGITTDTIRLGCTPIVNLFPQTSEPILLSERQPEYLLVPDARRRESIGIFSVDEVVAVSPGAAEPLRYEPLYSYRHGAGEGRSSLYWHAVRRPQGWRLDEGTDVYLSFADLSGRVVYPDVDAVTARLTCHNGDLPSRLPFGGSGSDFELPGGGVIRQIVTLIKPTPAIQPPLGRPQLWRLISQLSLNYASLVDGGVEGLQELLRLHNFAESPGGEKQIQGILDIQSRRVHSMVETEHGLTFARGHRVEIDFDEEQFAGGGVYLMASVLERFLGLYVSLNSFTILAARTRQRKEIIREWPPRTGWKALL
jgi:type VI secretion system protein ImpG